MEFGAPPFVVMIVIVCTAGWLINNWIRAKHGYPLEDEWGGKTVKPDTGETERLKAENKALHDKLDAMQDRMIVLEKIVTDRGYSLAQEIEALRDVRTADHGTGVPLGLDKKERV
ncbi:hypothetical protein ACLBKT_02380 [Erythrobacter sp. W302b]|jgi:hypothetical protein|uniref:hypothetical protein n=1 Tax=Erythrobacter sp. W302b TaxID=3389874 RepID=UPI00396B16F4